MAVGTNSGGGWLACYIEDITIFALIPERRPSPCSFMFLDRKALQDIPWSLSYTARGTIRHHKRRGVLSKVERTTCGGGAKPRRTMGARQCHGRKLQCFALLLALAGHRGSAEEETPLANVFATSKSSTAAVSPLQANLTAYQQKDTQACLSNDFMWSSCP